MCRMLDSMEAIDVCDEVSVRSHIVVKRIKEFFSGYPFLRVYFIIEIASDFFVFLFVKDKIHSSKNAKE